VVIGLVPGDCGISSFSPCPKREQQRDVVVWLISLSLFLVQLEAFWFDEAIRFPHLY
jgi:hypothetical protein